MVRKSVVTGSSCRRRMTEYRKQIADSRRLKFNSVLCFIRYPSSVLCHPSSKTDFPRYYPWSLNQSGFTDIVASITPTLLSKGANPSVLLRITLSLPKDKLDAWERSACYPRGSFYSLSYAPTIKERRITMTCFRTCSTCGSRSQAGLCHYTFSTISIRAKPTFVHLRCTLGGDLPSQTAHQTLFSCRIFMRQRSNAHSL